MTIYKNLNLTLSFSLKIRIRKMNRKSELEFKRQHINFLSFTKKKRRKRERERRPTCCSCGRYHQRHRWWGEGAVVGGAGWVMVVLAAECISRPWPWGKDGEGVLTIEWGGGVTEWKLWVLRWGEWRWYWAWAVPFVNWESQIGSLGRVELSRVWWRRQSVWENREFREKSEWT